MLETNKQSQSYSFDTYDISTLFTAFTDKKALLFIVVIGFIVYFNALFGKFVWDDIVYIALNPQIHTFNIPNLFLKNYFNNGIFYRPLAAVYLSLLYNLFGDGTLFYHLLQIFLHVSSACLLFLFFRKFASLSLSFIFALIFLIHPIQVESVTYIGGAASVLVFFFGITALLLSMSHTLSIKKLISIFVLLFIALLIKETGIEFLFLIVLYQALFHKKRVRIFLFFTILLLVSYFLLHFFTVGFGSDRNTSNVPIANLSVIARLMQMPAIIFYYGKTLLFPFHLAFNQFWVVRTFTLRTFYLPLFIELIIFSSIIVIGVLLYRSQKNAFRWYFFFLCWFVLGFGWYLQIIPLDMTVADRWFYIPFAGVLGMCVITLPYLPIHKKVQKQAVVTFAVLLLGFLAIRTMARNADWYDPYTLYAHDVPLESNYQNTNLLAVELINGGRYQEAKKWLEKSVSDYPQGISVYNLGNVYEKLSNYTHAELCYERVIMNKDIMKTSDEVVKLSYDGEIRVLLQKNNEEKLATFAKQSIQKYPHEGSYYAYLAIALYKLHRFEEAELAAVKAYTLLPNDTTKKLQEVIQKREPLKLKT